MEDDSADNDYEALYLRSKKWEVRKILMQYNNVHYLIISSINR